MSSTETLVLEELVVPLGRPNKRPRETGLQLLKAQRTSAVCIPCEPPPLPAFFQMRMFSIHANGMIRSSMLNRHYTAWVPFNTASSELLEMMASLRHVEAEEHKLGVHSCPCEDGAVSQYGLEAAVLVDPTDATGACKLTHTAMVDTSCIDLDPRWPRVLEWRAVSSPVVFSR